MRAHLAEALKALRAIDGSHVFIRARKPPRSLLAKPWRDQPCSKVADGLMKGRTESGLDSTNGIDVTPQRVDFCGVICGEGSWGEFLSLTRRVPARGLRPES
jgi:hypothetical protein